MVFCETINAETDIRYLFRICSDKFGNISRELFKNITIWKVPIEKPIATFKEQDSACLNRARLLCSRLRASIKNVMTQQCICN
jgi:hypothetical protein